MGKFCAVDLAHSVVDRSAIKVGDLQIDPNPSLQTLRNTLLQVSLGEDPETIAWTDSILTLLLKDCMEGNGTTM